MDRVCGTCEHFSPAHTCIEKPTWGYCTRGIGGKGGHADREDATRFTWADAVCRDYRPREPASSRRPAESPH